jgi:hypothetical protein
VPKFRKISQKNQEYMLNYSLPCSCSSNLSSFWLTLKQQWTIEEISIFSNSSHLEWRRSHLNLLLWNRWTKLNQTWQGWSLGGSLSNLCPTAPPSIQDGHCCSIQESFQQSLVEIGSVVSEEKIFFKFHPPFFLICIIGQNRQKFKFHKQSWVKMSSNLNCSYMARNSLTYIPGFSVKFFFQPIYTD